MRPLFPVCRRKKCESRASGYEFSMDFAKMIFWRAPVSLTRTPEIHMTCELHDRTVAILSYHKIGDPRPGGWKTWFYVPERTFLDHLNLLQDNGWAALGLPEFLGGLTNPENLPEKAVVISFDDGYQSVREVAIPLLRRFGYPSVLFVPTD